MQKIEPFETEKYYHIYNSGINGMDLFRENNDYKYFLTQYEKYIEPVFDTYAWCLMQNHFHLLVKIKEEKKSNFDSNTSRFVILAQHFTKLFSVYSQNFNKRYLRSGNLFERPFNRKQIDEESLSKIVVYIHNNPIHHGVVSNLNEYAWSSYLTLISSKTTYLKREEVVNWFGDITNFKIMHQSKVDVDSIEDWLEIE